MEVNKLSYNYFFSKIKKAIIYGIFDNLLISHITDNIKNIKNKRIFNYTRFRIRKLRLAENFIARKTNKLSITAHDESIFCILKLNYKINNSITAIATGSYDHKIKIWNSETGELNQVLYGHKDCINSLVNLPYEIYINNYTIASASTDKTIRIWDLELNQTLSVITSHSHYITCMNYSRIYAFNNSCNSFINNYLISGSYDKTIKVHTIQRENESSINFEFKLFQTIIVNSRVNTLTLINSKEKDNNSEIILVGLQDLRILLINYISNHVLKEFNSDSQIHSMINIKWSFNNSTIALAGSLNDILLINLNNLTNNLTNNSDITHMVTKTLKGHSDHVYCLVQVPHTSHMYTENIIVSGSTDYTIKFWNIVKGELIKSINAHNGYVLCLIYFIDDERSCSSCYKDNKSVCFNNCFCLDGEFVNKVQQNKKYDKKLTLISGSRDKTIKIWKSGLYS